MFGIAKLVLFIGAILMVLSGSWEIGFTLMTACAVVQACEFPGRIRVIVIDETEEETCSDTED